MEPGREYWQSWETLIPGNVPRLRWLSLQTAAFGSPFEGSPPLELKIRRRSFVVETNGNPQTPWSVIWTSRLATDRWVRFTWHFRLARDGWAELYVDGKHMRLANGRGGRVLRRHFSTIDASNWRGPWTARLAVYYPRGAASRVTAFARGFRIGTTRTSVEPCSAASGHANR
jgi:hypothetical protein